MKIVEEGNFIRNTATTHISDEIIIPVENVPGFQPGRNFIVYKDNDAFTVLTNEKRF